VKHWSFLAIFDQNKSTMQKKLERYPKRGMLGGVAYGLGEYFDTDPVLIRILFLVFTFILFGGALAYLICWLVMPVAAADYS